MAESGDDKNREDLSDEASPYRLEEFRKQGKVSQSKELTGLIGLFACGLALSWLAPSMLESLMQFMRDMFETGVSSRLHLDEIETSGKVITQVGVLLLQLAGPICAVGFIVSIISSFAQVGPVFSGEPIAPDWSRINPIKGFQRIVSGKNALDALRMILRGIVLVVVAVILIKPKIFDSLMHVFRDPDVLLEGMIADTKDLFFVLGGVMLVFAGVDWWMQRWEFLKSARLTKQEAKEEHKEHEGDPLLKARMRTLQRDRARKRMMEAVKKADVIVTNPTHIAIAIAYDRKKADAPRVVAKGADFLAQKIKQVAADAGIPMYEHVPLARTLYKTVKLGQTIPRSLYQAVAEVLAFVYKLKGNTQA